jgi:hypothetical protein
MEKLPKILGIFFRGYFFQIKHASDEVSRTPSDSPSTALSDYAKTEKNIHGNLEEY